MLIVYPLTSEEICYFTKKKLTIISLYTILSDVDTTIKEVNPTLQKENQNKTKDSNIKKVRLKEMQEPETELGLDQNLNSTQNSESDSNFTDIR